ncbi:MAG TPA: serine hydrolase domain-containing protein [Ktedonobacterales bacterium]|nr:serine hydrolase domain-containing protein [Ktedonobacterales bacterium]
MSGRIVRSSAVARSRLWLVLLLFLALSACTARAQSAAAPTPTAEPAYVAALRPKLAALMQKENVPGAIFSVQDPGKGNWTAAMGTADLATNAPISMNEHMRVGSITKTFTATVILQLAEEGKLHLDDPVAKYQPDVPNGAHITIRQLLNMTSRLYNYSEDAGFGETLLAQPAKVWQPHELLAIAFKHPPYFTPGVGFHYSNTNYILLGLIAEQLGGVPLAEQFQTRIFTPLGMRSTSLPPLTSAAIPNPHPQGYASKASEECPVAKALAQANLLCNVTTMNPSWAWAAGSAISTLADLRTWAKALATGTLLSAAMQQERLTWLHLAPGLQYGLGIFDIDGFLGHNGSLPGFQSFMGYRPAQRQMVIVLTNLDQGTNCAASANGGGPVCPSPADDLSKVIMQNVFGR